MPVHRRRSRLATLLSLLSLTVAACDATTETPVAEHVLSARAPGCASSADCSDGNFCNGAETCVNGRCVAAAPVTCEDGAGCTYDFCDGTISACRHLSDHGQCGAGQMCSGARGCEAPRACAADADCDDHVACNGLERCAAGACVGGAMPACDDGIECTSDFCAEGRGCVHVPVDLACGWGRRCTPGSGCTDMPACGESGDCDDNVHCNGLERCDGGQCYAGARTAVSDGVACTVDLCDEVAQAAVHVADDSLCPADELCRGASGCQERAGVTDCTADADCDDNVHCNGAEHCDGGACVDGARPICDDAHGETFDFCDEAAMSCAHLCQPDCAGRECGADPACGTSCGTCDADEVCTPDGRCRAEGSVADFQPCGRSSDCASAASDCVPLFGGGGYCAPRCEADDDCPLDTACGANLALPGSCAPTTTDCRAQGQPCSFAGDGARPSVCDTGAVSSPLSPYICLEPGDAPIGGDCDREGRVRGGANCGGGAFCVPDGPHGYAAGTCRYACDVFSDWPYCPEGDGCLGWTDTPWTPFITPYCVPGEACGPAYSPECADDPQTGAPRTCQPTRSNNSGFCVEAGTLGAGDDCEPLRIDMPAAERCAAGLVCIDASEVYGWTYGVPGLRTTCQALCQAAWMQGSCDDEGGGNCTGFVGGGYVGVCVTCGDYVCADDESSVTCPFDCGAVCGDGSCSDIVGENSCDCPQDCGDMCGDGVCQGCETGCNCPEDCGAVVCGDGTCGCGENGCDCPSDCGDVCDADGDGWLGGIYDDCDDANASIYPGAPELCNGVDDDCTGVADDNQAC